ISSETQPMPLIRGSSHSSRSEEHTSELQSHSDLVCRLLLEKKNKETNTTQTTAASKTVCQQKQHLHAYTFPHCQALTKYGSQNKLSYPCSLLFFFLNKGAPPKFSPFPPPTAFPS